MRVPIFVSDTQEKKAEAPDTTSPGDATLYLEPIPDKDALIVKINTPRAPAKDVPHVPCDIVLVIDVSASMGSVAPVPGESPEEDPGLTVLDLVKHAARTIIETMKESDRLGIVTFASRVKTLLKLTRMTDGNKELARKNIASMSPQNATNLWHGILEGIKLFQGNGIPGKAASMMVLTDGMPNHMCPPNGYVPKLRAMGDLPANIHTFGFGYSLRSGLLKSIAEIGGGNYAFIPDAGMIGTVFVHAVANMQATFATNAVLTLAYDPTLELEETMGKTVDQQAPKPLEHSRTGKMLLTMHLGSLQYGQPRGVFLRVKNIQQLTETPEKSGFSFIITAKLTYVKAELEDQSSSTFAGFLPKEAATRSTTSSGRSLLDSTSLSTAEIAYHESRARVCSFLDSMFPLGWQEEHRADPSLLAAKRDELANLIKTIPASEHTDAHNRSLVEDLAGEEPRGQISLAIGRDGYFNKWGVHYLPSLLNAHQRQICNSFKDPGPLMYGKDSPLFVACRDRLDNAFDNLPAPEPSRDRQSRFRNAKAPPRSGLISMSRYRSAVGVCFAASSDVELASGRKVEIGKLRRGMRVRTPLGPRRVAAVLKTPVEQELLCRKGRLFATPWHPISRDGGKMWAFPAQMADGAVVYTGSVYSVMLERDGNSSAHAIRVGGVWGVTLGHGVKSGSDARAHEFFGDYDAVRESLAVLERRKGGVVVGGGVDRDEATGLVKGFRGNNSHL